MVSSAPFVYSLKCSHFFNLWIEMTFTILESFDITISVAKKLNLFDMQ